MRWFTDDRSRPNRAARALRDEFEAGTLVVIVPSVARLDLLDAAAEHLSAGRLASFADAAERIGFEYREPAPSDVASWLTRGLTAAEAAYAAVASANDLRLVTANPRLLAVAAPVVQPLG